MYVDNIGRFDMMVVPDVLEQHGAGDDLSRVSHQAFQQAILARQQLNRLAGMADGTGEQVHHQLADAQHGLALWHAGMPPQQHVQPRGQLQEVERLGEVVVAAGTQPAYPLIHPR